MSAKILGLNQDLLKAVDQTNNESILQLLTCLEEESELINSNILRTTNLGKTLNKLTKINPNPNIVSKSKSLIRKWKNIIQEQKQKPVPNTNTNTNTNTNINVNTIVIANANTNTNINMHSNSNSSHSKKLSNHRHSKSLSLSSNSSNTTEDTSYTTGNQKRDKVIIKLKKLLKPADTSDQYMSYEELAIKIEEELFKFSGNDASSSKYFNHVMELGQNLKDPNNPELNKRLLCGTITPEEVVKMDHEQLASDKVKQQRQLKYQENLADARSDNLKSESMTEEYKCSKCQQRKCSYYQQQVRSADEPMTVYITCLMCGNRWKH